MFQEFINYLKYIGFISEETFPIFSSKFNSIHENENKNKKLKIINSMINYIKSLSEEQTIKIMTGIYERYLENKIKISSNKLLNLLKIYQNKEIKFYMVYWNKLSQYLMHKEIQQYQTNNINLYERKTLNNNSTTTIKGNNIPFPNNISTIKAKNSELNTISVNNISNNVQCIKPKNLSKEFIERQEKFIQMKQEKLMKNIDNNEEEFQLLYTFKPCLVNSMKSFNVNNKYRNENLYNNKMHEMRMKNLREAIDNERGYTFKPRINSYKKIHTTKKNE